MSQITLTYKPEKGEHTYTIAAHELSTEVKNALLNEGFKKLIGQTASAKGIPADEAHNRRLARVASLIAGEVVAQGETGSRLSLKDPLAPFVRTVLENAVRNACQKAGKALPKQGAAFTAAMEAIRAAHGDEAVRAKAEALRSALAD